MQTLCPSWKRTRKGEGEDQKTIGRLLRAGGWKYDERRELERQGAPELGDPVKEAALPMGLII